MKIGNPVGIIFKNQKKRNRSEGNEIMRDAGYKI
jgi:hypothetical protein